jgi:hypothetical protein
LRERFAVPNSGETGRRREGDGVDTASQGSDHQVPVFVGESLVIRYLPRVAAACAVVPMVHGDVAATIGLLLPSVLVAVLMPWRFAVLDDGIVLCFGFRRWRFLAREIVAVRADLASPVVYASPAGRLGFPVPGAASARRRRELRSQLLVRGFRVLG